MKQPSSEEESGWKSHRNCALGTWCINLQIADGDLCLKQNRSNKKTYIIQRHNHLVFSCKCFHIFLVNSSFPFSTRNPSRLRGPSRRSLTNGAWRKRPSACAPRRRKPQVPLEDGADGDALTPFFFFSGPESIFRF